MLNHLVMYDSLWPHELDPDRLLCLWDSPGKNTGVGCHFLLQGNFLTQGMNPSLLPPGKPLYCEYSLIVAIVIVQYTIICLDIYNWFLIDLSSLSLDHCHLFFTTQKKAFNDSPLILLEFNSVSSHDLEDACPLLQAPPDSLNDRLKPQWLSFYN